MIAEALPGFYDFEGRRISRPSKKRHMSFEGRPMGSFLSQPLKVVCRDLDEIRAFLSTCHYVSDREQFGVRDYWMRPEDFERVRRGDCDDFALWTWRQLLGLGYSARFVTGSAARYGAGHAWVSFRVDKQLFIVEPLLAWRREFRRRETLRCGPSVSIEVDGSRVKFFEHKTYAVEPPLRVVAPLVPEWLLHWHRIYHRWLIYLGRASRWRFRRIFTQTANK